MRKRVLLIGSLVLLACPGFALAQAYGPRGQPTLSQLEDRFAGIAEQQFVPAADAMPEEKYSFAPTNGEFRKVRTFGDMVKHVAVSNYGMAGAILHEKPPVKLDTQSDLDSIRTKADIMAFLKGSFAYLHKALSSITEKNQTDLIRSPDSDEPLARLEVADRALWHSNNHYGQLVMYLRMNGIVPPASRHAS